MFNYITDEFLFDCMLRDSIHAEQLLEASRKLSTNNTMTEALISGAACLLMKADRLWDAYRT